MVESSGQRWEIFFGNYGCVRRNEVLIFNDRLNSRPDVVCRNAVRAAAVFFNFYKS